MRVSLIGGCGFIGHRLAAWLRLPGHEVQVIDNLMWNNMTNVVMGADCGFIRDLNHGFLMDRFDSLRLRGVKMVNTDARSAVDLTNALSSFDPDCIVHLSAISSALRARENPGLCFDLQLVTLKNVLEYCVRAKTKAVLMSSSTVYGDFQGDEVTEDTRPRPKGIYANAKYMAERLVRTYADQYGVNSTIIRPSALYGERCVSRRVSQRFIENALMGKPLVLDGGGEGRLDFTYIEDLVDGITRAIESPREGTHTYNITYGQARTVFELAEIVKSIVPCDIEVGPSNPLAPKRGTLSTKRAEDELGFEPKWPLETGYRRYCEWYKEQWNALCARRSRVDAFKWHPAPDQAVQPGLPVHTESNRPD